MESIDQITEEQSSINDFILQDETKIYVCYRPIRPALGVFNHHFFKIPDLDLEIHPGRYYMGTHHKVGYVRHATVYGQLILCPDCVRAVLFESKQMEDAWYFPLINCEALTKGSLGYPPISYQTIFIFTAIVCAIASIFSFSLLFVGLFFLVLTIIVNNWSSPMYTNRCQHLAKQYVNNLDETPTSNIDSAHGNIANSNIIINNDDDNERKRNENTYEGANE